MTFWAVLRIFADRGLLRAVRDELARFEAINIVVEPEIHHDAAATTTTGKEEKKRSKKRQLNMSRLAKNNYACVPLLHAVYREVLRLGSNNIGARLVLGSDTHAATPTALPHQASDYVHLATSTPRGGESFVLRKGGIVQIAGGVVHADPCTWGDDTGEFNPRRHQMLGSNPSSTTTTLSVSEGGRSSTTRRGAWRPFGGGKTMCPGKTLATSEILALVTCIEVDDYIMPVHILEPVAGDPVRVRTRLREPAEEEAGRVEIVP